MNPVVKTVGFEERNGDTRIVLFRPNFPPEVWEDLAPMLAPSLQYGYGEYGLSDINKWCRAGTSHLWAYYENDTPIMAMVTCFVIYPGAKYLHVVAFGGSKLLRTMRMWPVVERFMQFNDCVRITAYARPQMVKALKRFGGFRDMYTVVTRTGKGVH